MFKKSHYNNQKFLNHSLRREFNLQDRATRVNFLKTKLPTGLIKIKKVPRYRLFLLTFLSINHKNSNLKKIKFRNLISQNNKIQKI